MTLTPSPADGITFRIARPGEGAVVQKLAALADQAQSDYLATVLEMIDNRERYANTMVGWGLLHAVVAQNPVGAVIGAAAAMPNYSWLADFVGRLSQSELQQVSRQFFYITSIAVEPDERRRGVGRRLVDSIERVLLRVGCRLVAADYNAATPEELFWESVGYDVDPTPNRQMQLTFTDRDVTLAMVSTHGYCTAVKVLDENVTAGSLDVTFDL